MKIRKIIISLLACAIASSFISCGENTDSADKSKNSVAKDNKSSSEITDDTNYSETKIDDTDHSETKTNDSNYSEAKTKITEFKELIKDYGDAVYYEDDSPYWISMNSETRMSCGWTVYAVNHENKILFATESLPSTNDEEHKFSANFHTDKFSFKFYAIYENDETGMYYFFESDTKNFTESDMEDSILAEKPIKKYYFNFSDITENAFQITNEIEQEQFNIK